MSQKVDIWMPIFWGDYHRDTGHLETVEHGAYMLLIAATRRGELAVIAPVRYIKVPCAVMLGALIWGHVPDPVSLAGFAIIIAAGLYTLQRERLAARRAN